MKTKFARKFLPIVISLVMMLSVFGVQASVFADENSKSSAPAQIDSTVTLDPSHSVTVTWTTEDTTLTNPVVNVWQASQSESSAVSFQATTRVIGAQTYGSAATAISTEAMNSYTATVTGLTPNTTYSYRVGVNGNMSDICTFKTAPSDNSNFTFTMIGDPQNDFDVDDQLASNKTFAAVANKVPNSSFTYIVGDFTDLANQAQWNGFFGTGANQLFQSLMTVGAEGNHEVTGYDGTSSTKSHLDTNAVLFNEHFNFPSVTYNGTLLRNCYSFDYGPVHFMTVNTNYSDSKLGFNPTPGLSAMAAWLDADASASKKPWKIVLLHKDLYSGATHVSDPDLTELRKALTPVINKNHIDAVLGGHDHTFARGFVDATGAKVNPIVQSQSSTSYQLESSPQGQSNPTTTPGAIYTIPSITETVIKPDAPLYFMNNTGGGLKWYAQNSKYIDPTYQIPAGDPITPNYSFLDRDSTTSASMNIQEQTYSVINVTTDWIQFNTYMFDYANDPTAENAILYDSYTVNKAQSLNERPTSSGGGSSSGGESSSPVVPAPTAPTVPILQRLAGASRIDTSIAIAKQQFTDKQPDAVVLASGNDFPDALAGSGVAYKYNAPLLLVNNSVNDSKSVLDYINSNLGKNKNIYILGGTASVSKEVSDYLSSQGYNIMRLGGKDRYETNQKIVDNLNIAKGTPIVITNGNNFADALSISSIADINGYPVLLNDKDNLLTNVSNYIANIQPTTVYVVGGTGVLSTNIEAQIKKLNGNINIVRLAGNDRYETSMKIAEYFSLKTTTITVASGTNFPDALSGSVLAARKNSSVLLVDNNDISRQKDLLNKQNIMNVIVLGGEGVISGSTANSLIQK